MTDPRSVSSAVTVNVSPDVAFSAFTSEMDLWWVRGPINFFDSARAVSMISAQRLAKSAHKNLDDVYKVLFK